MSTFIPRAPRPAGFLGGLTAGAEKAIPAIREQLLEKKERQRAAELREQEDIAAEQQGIPLKGLTSPAVRKAVVEAHFKQKKAGEEAGIEDQRVQTIARYWGQKAAELYGSLTEGGKSHFTKTLLEGIQRGLSVDDMLRGFFQEHPEEAQNIIQRHAPAPQEEPEPPPEDNIPFGFREAEEAPEEAIREAPEEAAAEAAAPAGRGEFQWPVIKPQPGLTPKERVSIERDREKVNSPVYKEMAEKRTSAKREGLLLNRLEQLNESKKLPTQTQSAFIVGSDGSLRVRSGWVNPETQLYVKTVNEFTSRAKDSYGARVTNFDLEQFMTRLPTLANSEGGRRLIIRQMKILNELDELEKDSLLKAYDHYGTSGVSLQQAYKAAAEYREVKEDELLKRYAVLDGAMNSVYEAQKIFKELPSAEKYPGRVIQDNKGRKFKSNGKKWVKVE